MGALNCACFENLSFDSQHESDALNKEKLNTLIKGNKFTRNAFLGLTKQELYVKLTEDTTAIQWKTENTWTKSENGEIDLTSQVKKLRPSPDHGLQVIGLDGGCLLDIKAEDESIRDHWIVTLNELLNSWTDHPEKRPKSSVKADNFSNKAEYFKQREAEIIAREKISEDRKAKYSAGGMKYSAIAMANRS